MKISVFGLGYVGCVTAACLARDGHQVIGVDVNLDKVKAINDGRSPVLEPGLDNLIAEMVLGQRLSATGDAGHAMYESEVALICVGTPNRENGSLDLRYLEQVCGEIGDTLKRIQDYRVIVIRSTVLPGTTQGCIVPILEQTAHRKLERDFGVCVNPEFMREGSSLRDFREPPFTLVGEIEPGRASEVVAQMYAGTTAPLIRTTARTAEMLKYVNNTWHALKVAFANEIGALCQTEAIDANALMELFCRDTRLNISAAYLIPGFAFGGSCLPKELRALTYYARTKDLRLPLIESVMPSNDEHIRRALRQIVATGKKRVAMLGLSFKSKTDDLRDSPFVALAETLLGKGYDLRIYDPDVRLAELTGTNKAYIEREIPHIGRLFVNSAAEMTSNAEVIVVGKSSQEFADALARAGKEKIIVNLVGDSNQMGSD
ncbi:MAG: nucleotide sugar dehydrogenase [Chloroflexota bacterium]